MRAIADELAQRMSPELTSADARERAALARMVLEQLAADLDVLPEVAQRGLAQEFRREIEVALQSLPARHFAEQIRTWRSELAAIAPEQDGGAQRQMNLLRALASSIVRYAADMASEAGVRESVSRLGSVDHRWLTSYETARQQKTAQRAAATPQGDAAAAPATLPDPTARALTQYLRRRFPTARLESTAVVPIPGGRSKKTFFISLEANDTLPSELVMRQDYALRYEGTKVRDEYTPLLKLAQRGLAVPRPLLLEAGETELGPPFLLVERLPGGPPGSYFGMRTPCPGAFRELALMLAQLHRIPPAELGFSAVQSTSDSLLLLIETYQRKWRENATRASPLIDYAYAWAKTECAKDPSALAIVHGDAGPYNLLIDNDRLSALLDWEFVHVGDPAVDLGIVRVYAEEFMSWDEFMTQYTAAGGAAVPERRIQLGMLVNFLKGTTLVATSGRNFEEGWTREFVKGANSFTGLRLIELRIAALMRRFGAV
jgi:aminoglycoside phosphotransferase (APT) family kinase protein